MRPLRGHLLLGRIVAMSISGAREEKVEYKSIGAKSGWCYMGVPT